MVSANASLVSEVTYKCFPCNKSFKSLEMLDEHKKSKKHKKNEKEYMKKHPDASDSSIFKSISHNQSEKGEEKNTANILDGINEEIQSSAGFSIVGEQESKNGEKIHQKTTLDSLRVCLFCNKESDGVKKNIDHMRIKHSFTILDIDCLVDLKGLLTYMAQRIHIGKICLFCSKQFKDARSCQQHMMDCGHCMMNMEDEDEYVDFYDFSKTYQNHPLMIQEQGDSIQEEGSDEDEAKKDGSDSEWDDCDLESMDSKEAAEEQNEKVESHEQKNVTTDSDRKETSSFSEVEPSDENLGVESLSSMTEGEKQKTKYQGMTKDEVLLGLKVKKAERLHTGEVKLGNGKVMGIRKFHYIYKQKPKLPDTREAVLVNKIALEYRQMRAI